MNNLQKNRSVLGRLLEELSWVGSTIRNYREGGRGYENVLTAEALQGLDFLPRRSFLGAVVEQAHGAESARSLLASEMEDADFTLLPGNRYLKPSGNGYQNQLPVQPDGIIESASVFAVLEAKRIRRNSFQPEQLAREYVLALRDAAERKPILFLVLGAPPPVQVSRTGKMAIPDAIHKHLPRVLAESEGHELNLAQATDIVEHAVCWITWQEISDVVAAKQQAFDCVDQSLKSSINRLADSVIRAIAWHA